MEAIAVSVTETQGDAAGYVVIGAVMIIPACLGGVIDLLRYPRQDG